MSIYWGLKKEKTNRKYIIIKHPLRFMGNLSVEGVKFCAGCGVVEENSKAHRRIMSLPMFRKAKILSLDFLKKMGFKPRDIQMIFGYDIYRHYLDAIGLNPDLTPMVKEVSKETTQPFDDVKVQDLITENKEELDKLPDKATKPIPEEEILAYRKEEGLCLYKREDGSFCANKSVAYSKGGMCFGHIKYDPTRPVKTETTETKEEL